MKLLAAVAVLSLALASGAHAQKIDKAGKCHGADGKFAKMEACKGVSAHTYKLDAKGACHDETGKFAKKAMCPKGGQLDFSKPENSALINH